MSEKEKKSKKAQREENVLFGLIEIFLKTGKPIGSNTLQENGFQDLSSATIRNYFAELEKQQFLKQAHASGGRIPTNKALRLYALAQLPLRSVDPKTEERLHSLLQEETKLLSVYLQKAAELLNQVTGLAVFFSSLRCDNDMILDIRLLQIDATRVLAVLITDLGQVITETLSTEKKFSSFVLKRMETYFHWRLQGSKESEAHDLIPEELELAKLFYTEIMMRYLARYSNYTNEEIFKSGFSHLLSFPEFNDPSTLGSALSLFENTPQLRVLINDCLKANALQFWIGSDLAVYAASSSDTTVIAIPYHLNQHPVGVFGLLGPTRVPYRQLFGTLSLFANYLSETLTKSLFKFKLSFRHPRSPYAHTEYKAWAIEGQPQKLLGVNDDKRNP